MPQNAHRLPRKVPIARALSKLGIMSRKEATAAVRAARVRVNGRIVLNPAALVEPERARILVDEVRQARAAWRTVLLNKPRGVVTTRRDPEGRRTIYDVLGEGGQGLVAVGRLDLASTGLLLLTSDTRLADWVTNPVNGVTRVYVVTVRGRVSRAALEGPAGGAHTLVLRKSSSRESHLVVELREGKNREVRRLFDALGHEVTRLKRVSFGGLELGQLAPGEWREVSRDEIRRAFPGAPLRPLAV